MAARPGRDATFGAINQRGKIWMETTKGGSKLAILLGPADRKVGYRDEATSDTIRTFISIKRWP